MTRLKNSKLWAYIILFLSIGCLAVIAYAVWGVREGALGFRSAVSILTYAAQIGIGVLVCSLIMLAFSPLNRKKMAIASTIILIPLVSIYFLNPASTQNTASGQRPKPLNDISTDTQNPPVYNAVIDIRPEKSNTLSYPGESAATLQAERFPSIAPITTQLSLEQAFNTALEIVKNNGWQVIEADVTKGIIEAVDATLVFNFKDDVIIRVTENESGRIVDIRSHSRIGRGDMNKNGNRVMRFISDFNDLL